MPRDTVDLIRSVAECSTDSYLAGMNAAKDVLRQRLARLNRDVSPEAYAFNVVSVVADFLA